MLRMQHSTVRATSKSQLHLSHLHLLLEPQAPTSTVKTHLEYFSGRLQWRVGGSRSKVSTKYCYCEKDLKVFKKCSLPTDNIWFSNSSVSYMTVHVKRGSAEHSILIRSAR